MLKTQRAQTSCTREAAHLVLRRQTIEDVGGHIAQSIKAIAICTAVVGSEIVVIVLVQTSLSTNGFRSLASNRLVGVLEMAPVGYFAFLAMIAGPFTIALAMVSADGLS